MNVIIVHGWKGYPPGHWIEWLNKTLKEKEIKTQVPSLPNANQPKLKEWLTELKKLGPFNSNTILVGHSLGCTAILRLLEELPEAQKVGKIILVSTALGISSRDPNRGSFFTTPFNWKKIRKKGKFIVVHSDNDPYFSLEKGIELASELGVECIVEHNAKHISTENGFGPYPKLLEMILKQK